MNHQRHSQLNTRPALVEALTPREREVLALLALGMPNKQIAAALNIEWKTVKYHVGNICAKLGAKNRTHAAMLAIAHEIVSKN